MKNPLDHLWVRLSLGLFLALVGAVLIFLVVSGRQDRELVWAQDEAEMDWRWAELPIKVYVDRDWGAHVGSAMSAMKAMNSGAGCELMAMADNLDDADVHIQYEVCSTGNPDHAGCTWRDRTSGIVVVQVGQPGDVTQSFVVFFHELTHVWGLAHDGYYTVPRSGSESMFVPITANNAGSHAYRLGRGKRLPSLSDKDKSALANRYCAP